MSEPDVLEEATEILDTMLGYLGFPAQITREETADGAGLQVYTGDSSLLIGEHGATLDDLQYLVNTLLQNRHPDAPKIRVDVEQFRAMREDRFLTKVQAEADKVRRHGQMVMLPAMNSYQRRLVHQAFKDDPQVTTESTNEKTPLKQIRLVKRR